MEDKKRAVAYMRYSSDHQTENSIEYQRSSILAYCERHNVDLVREYVDEAYTATNARRPGFQAMIRDAMDSPDWDTVLVFDLSRFSRKLEDSLSYKNILMDAGIELVSITQEFGDSNEGFLLEGITNLLNEFYSRNNGKHTHAGLSVKAKAALHCGGRPPLGYDVGEDKKLVVNHREAEAVKAIFDMYELNYSYARMAQTLNQQGYKTKRGLDFCVNSFISILRQEKYVGTYVWNKASAKDRNGRRNNHRFKPIRQQILLPGACPQIIEEAQFRRVQQKLNANKGGRAKGKTHLHYMLNGLEILKCKACGMWMTGESRQEHGKHRVVYSCPNHKGLRCPTKPITADDLERWVAKLLINQRKSTVTIFRTDLKAVRGARKNRDIAERLIYSEDLETKRMLKEKIKEISVDNETVTYVPRR